MSELPKARRSCCVTPGIAKCAEGESSPDLFQVAQGLPLDYALEQASVMMGCVHRLTFVGVMEKDETLVWAAHLLSGLGRALVEDVRVALSEAAIGCPADNRL